MKKQNKSIKKEKIVYTNSDTDYKKVLKVGFIVLIIFVAFYFLTIYLTSRPDTSNNLVNKETTDYIQYEKILAGESFNMKDQDYLVLYYDETSSELKSEFTTMITTYKEKEEHLPVYIVNTADAINQQFVGEESNTSPSQVTDLKIKDSTLIHFTDKEVIDYIEGKDQINDYLK